MILFIFSYSFGESKFFKVVGVFVRRLDFWVIVEVN